MVELLATLKIDSTHNGFVNINSKKTEITITQYYIIILIIQQNYFQVCI